jgi:uncharacterized membrane protein (UPF0182 family)
MGGRVSWIVILVALFLAASGVTLALNLYFDLLWFQELGKTVLFTTALYAKSTLATGALLVVFAFVYANLFYAQKGPGAIQIGIPTPTGQITAYQLPQALLSRIIGIVALVLAAFFALSAAERWEVVWRWRHAVDFQRADPVFGRDISFYFFTLPLWNSAVSMALTLTFLTGAGVIALYHFKGALTLRGRRTFGNRGRVGYHISALAAFAFLLLAADAYLDRFEILFADHPVLYGASYADLNARLPLLSVLALACLAGAALWIYNAFAASNRAAVASVALYAVALVATNAYPAIVQKFVVAPNELGKESPQIQHNIRATLEAYGLEDVQDRSLSGDRALTPGDIQANAATIKSIRLWDHEPLLDAFRQIQEIRTYYDFAAVDNDRYPLNGENQQTMLSVRELNSTSLPERNWINERLSYTHGYGLTLGPVNRATSEGLPVLLVKDLPPQSLDPALKITRPEIYFGELTTGYVVVKTGQQEFDYPSGEENVYTDYEGRGGVAMASFARRLLFALYLKDPNILLSPLLKSESRFMYFRDIKTRASRLAPFLRLDQDPYLVISDGRLVWMQDAYTVGDRYPYSVQTRQVGNYIRNSVKIVIDAYDGSVEMYVADPKDPLIQVYQKIFPGVFKPLAELPAGLKAHLRYPEDIFRIQTFIYAVYHMDNPQIFYNKEDLWEIPTLGAAAGGERPMAPYYTIMRLPQEKREEFILMLPFTPGRKDNLSAWMVARSDGEHYGQLVVYRFPKQKLIYGPKQIVARINQDAEIARQISLWDQRGSQVIQGNLLVIPIEEALLYVRPLYLRAQAGKIPELKRVIVAYENRIAMEETLEESIARIFQGEAVSEGTLEPEIPVATGPASTAPPSSSGLVEQAKAAYDRAVQAQRQGDWARYGEQLKRLGAILEELNRTPRENPKP